MPVENTAWWLLFNLGSFFLIEIISTILSYSYDQSKSFFYKYFLIPIKWHQLTFLNNISQKCTFFQSMSKTIAYDQFKSQGCIAVFTSMQEKKQHQANSRWLEHIFGNTIYLRHRFEILFQFSSFLHKFQQKQVTQWIYNQTWPNNS